MDATPTVYASDVAFSPTVKAIQARKGSRAAYGRMEERGSWETRITPDLAGLHRGTDERLPRDRQPDGQPYIQHRGGPPGFLHVLDDRTIGFADFAGNRQYITQGNLADNPKAQLFLIDYAHRRRVKIWGEARVVEGDPELLAKLMPEGYKARPEQAILFTVAAWDFELSAAHPAAVRGRRRRRRARRARPPHRGAGSRDRAVACGQRG